MPPEISDISRRVLIDARSELGELVATRNRTNQGIDQLRLQLGQVWLNAVGLELPQRIRLLGFKARYSSEPRNVEAMCRRLQISEQGSIKLVVSIYQNTGALGVKTFEIADDAWEHVK